MSKEYKIEAVSEKIKNWSSQYGDFTTYYAKLVGEGDEAVQVNKKSDSPAPQEGDELYGEIQETEFGKKFKSQKKPFGSNTRTPESQDTQDNIARSVALKAAVDAVNEELIDVDKVLEIADRFLAWLQNTGSESQGAHLPADRTQEEKSQPARDWDSLHKSGKEQADPEWTNRDIPPEFQ